MKRCLLMLIVAVVLAPHVAQAQKQGGAEPALSLPKGSQPAPTAPWFRAEKVRCISYLDASELMVSSVPKVREMGFNCALVQTAGAPPRQFGPLIEAADRAGLRLVLVTYFNTDDYLKQSGDERRFVGADGLADPNSPCPTDARYWRATIGAPALRLAELRAAGHPSVQGVLFDMEDYPNLRDTAVGPMSYCFCDDCFNPFLKSIGKDDRSLAAAQRKAWLVEQGLLGAYHAFQDDAVVAVFAGIRQQVDALAPEFMFASYPWLYVKPADRKSRIDWDIRFARGLGTEAAPFMVLDETTYIWGYGPQIERQQADLHSLGLNFLAVTGFNLIPAERVWYPQQMADSAYWACKRSDGYWFYVGAWPLLYAPAGRESPYDFGGLPQQWVKAFTTVNQAITAGRRLRTQPLTLFPIESYWTLSELYNVKSAPGARAWVRAWTDIALPWEGGELVMVGGKQGDWLSFDCHMGRPDLEEILAWLTTGSDRAIVQLYLDGEPLGGPVDLYSSVTIPGDAVSLGYKYLTRGDRNYKFVAVGKNEHSTGYSIGLRALWTEDIGYPPKAWSVIGPFDNTGEDMPGFDAVYPPEREIDLDAAYNGKNGEPTRWRQVETDPNGFLNLAAVYGARNAAAYCLTYIYSPVEGRRDLLIGSGDGGKLWVNGEYVWGEPVGRAPEPEQNRLRVHLRKGWNTVLFKVLRQHGSWGIYFRFRDREPQVEYSPAPPA
jgi:hypothetical protein